MGLLRALADVVLIGSGDAASAAAGDWRPRRLPARRGRLR